MDRTPGVAVLYDFENVHAAAYDLLHGNGSYGTSTDKPKRLFTHLGPLKRAVEKRFGPVLVHRAYANWAAFQSYAADLAAALVEQVYVPPMGGKNSADIWLAADAVELGCDRPDLTHFVIASCDGDFSRVAQRLRARGKTVIGVGLDGARIKAVWRQSCDEYHLLPRPTPAGGPVSAKLPRPPSIRPTALDTEYRELLAKSDIEPFELPRRFALLSAVAAAFRSAVPPVGTATDVLDGFLTTHVRRAVPDASDAEVKRLRTTLYGTWLVERADSRWRLSVPAEVAALEGGFVRAFLVRLRQKLTGDPDAAAVRRLLFGTYDPTADVAGALAAVGWAAGRQLTPAERAAVVTGGGPPAAAA